MDGFDTTTNIIVMAATNRPDILDSALLRAGRFDRKIMVSRPTYEERISIFDYYLRKKKVADSVKIDTLAKRTSGLVGADIENIVNEASLKIAKDERISLEKHDFEYALEKVLMGPEKKVKSMNEKEKNIVAFHELGHAVTAYLLPQADPVEKISIVRR
jgi:cell division protease FtsH